MTRCCTGPEVAELQEKLVQLGYGFRSVNGQFGSTTEATIRRSQGDNRLKVDGLAGPQTINEIHRLTGQSTNASEKAIGYKNIGTNLLARCVNGEARGESFEGQVAVASDGRSGIP